MKYLILILIILASCGFFFAVLNHIADRQDKKAMDEIERREFEEAALLIHHIRASEAIGLNLKGNPEL
jgi:protein-arginine kinase activator protein McsA